MARLALNCFIAIISAIAISGCTSSTEPTYLKKDVERALQDILNKEYSTQVTAKLTGQTLWVYLPVEDIFVKSDKPQKYIEKFEIKNNTGKIENNIITLEYLIQQVPEKEKIDEYKFNKEIQDKITNVMKTLRRIIFSIDNKKTKAPDFYCLVVADTKNGIILQQTFYQLDFKKAYYDFISWTEFQHRIIQIIESIPEVTGNKDGTGYNFYEISMPEFILTQITNRIKLKFQKPEVEKGADIENEILKVVINTIKIYEFRDFNEVELVNLATNNKTILNQPAIRAKFNDKLF
ncbi:MAG: hypothetical protein C4533_01280 [Candidatus Omnitrophota bacterium]|nr:MAG: hypothetical protein C4533_01280 [Candidatus Omnitrophota bacterium]